LDIAGGASSRGSVIRPLNLAVLLFAALSFADPRSLLAADHDPELSTKVKQLAAEKRWPEIVRVLDAAPARDADLDYYYGTALAQVSRLDDARQAFLRGRRLAPNDARFPTELAGLAFQQKNYPAAASWIKRALRIEPREQYANDFLATVYFLEGNLEAALKYWNRVGKPYIDSVQPQPLPRLRPSLLDRALSFSPAAVLRLSDLETTRARLEGLGVFPDPRIQLAARPDGKFDVSLELQERNGWGANVWEALISTFSGVAYQTIYPEYDNIGGAAINVSSLVRWDAQKRRLAVTLSGPLRQNPKWRSWLGVDLRNENWDIRNSFEGAAPTLAALNLRRESATVGIDGFETGRWGWSASGEFSHRDYRNVLPGTVFTPRLLLAGSQLKQISEVHYRLLETPEHRLWLNTGASLQLGRIWSQPAHGFAKLQGSVQLQWSPESQGDDYLLRSRIRGGGTGGQPPFDELYMLGMERDNDLWMRAHIGTRDGRKGSAPLGHTYFLSNNEADKNIYGNGLITVKLSPFLDNGKITDPGDQLGSQKWLWDTGVQAKLRVLGVGVAFIYGKDLRTGNNAYYFTAGR
jgi:tetratricopeptide (TPR) repeat protein